LRKAGAQLESRETSRSTSAEVRYTATNDLVYSRGSSLNWHQQSIDSMNNAIARDHIDMK